MVEQQIMDQKREENGPLGAGSESRVKPDGPGDPVVRAPNKVREAPMAPRESEQGAAQVASGLSNYSSRTQYGNQAQYGTPAQYNEERMVGGDVQNGDHPEDRPATGASGPAHPNG
jgi:hypothetical protein